MAFSLDLKPHPGPGGPLSWARVPWDSDALGLEVFEIRFEDDAVAVERHLPSLLPQLRGLVVARVAVGQARVARVLSAHGFYAIETTFELSLPLARRDSAKPVRFPAGFQLREAVASDREPIVEIARRAFDNDRYHLEPSIASARADARMAGWVERALDEGDPVFVLADREGRALGFFHVRPDAEGGLDLSLAAVAPELKRVGLGPLLYAAVLDEGRDRGFRTAYTRIAAQNLDVLNVYAHLGFQFLRSLMCFHRPA